MTYKIFVKFYEDENVAIISNPSSQPIRYRQVLYFQKSRIIEFALIALATIAQDGHDGMVGTELLGEPDGTGNIDAAGAAKAKPFFLDKVKQDR